MLQADRLVEEWIEDQVKKIADNKYAACDMQLCQAWLPAYACCCRSKWQSSVCRYGCKLSQKLFVGRDYVLKHVRLKHAEKVEEQRSKASFPH